MQYKDTKKIMIDQRKLETLFRIGCPDNLIIELLKTGTFTPTGDSLIDDNLETLLDYRHFLNTGWGGKRNGAGRKSQKTAKNNQDENQDENQLDNQDKIKFLDKDIDNDIVKEKGVVEGKEKTQTLIADLEKEELAKVKSTHNDIDWADVQDRWNRIATKYNLAKIAAITEKRKQQFKARLAEHKITVEQFFYFVNKALWTSPFLQGYTMEMIDGKLVNLENPNKWKASFDFCLQSSSFAKIRENKYAERYPELLAEWELLEKGEGNADEIQTL